MSLKKGVTNIEHEIKKLFIRTDLFREHVEDHLAVILSDMSKFTALDEVKEALIQTAITAGLSYIPVIGGGVALLSSTQVHTISVLVVEYGHKAEKLMAEQLAKHDEIFKENATKA